MLSKKMEEALNQQINAELFAAYLYLSEATWFESVDLPGCAKWMAAHAQEELGHAMRIYQHVHERRGRVTLAALEAPPTEWESPLAAFQAAMEHEEKVTGKINDLVDLAAAEDDKPAAVFLQWFVSEQVEEEETLDGIIQQFRRAGDAPQALLMLDRAMGERAGE
ncbi:MAG: ferritin [Candidatus Brocadiia bacterium]